MKLEWEGEEEDRLAAIRAAEERDRLEARVNGAPIVIANEFSEVQVSRVETRNGSRLMIKSPRSGQWVSLCPWSWKPHLAGAGNLLGHDRASVRAACHRGRAAAPEQKQHLEAKEIDNAYRKSRSASLPGLRQLRRWGT